MMLIDSHCHLDLTQFDTDRDAVVARAGEADVKIIVNPGIDLAHSRRAIALTERYAGVYAAVGVHPNSAGGFDQATCTHLRELAAHPKVLAIGEIGLDYHWDTTPVERQKQAFVQQLELASDLGLPVIVHSRESDDDVAEILRDWVTAPGFQESPLGTRCAGGRFAGVLHAFGGNEQLARAAYDWGFVLSLGGPVTFKNARELHELVPALRLDRLMLETDAPYLTPHPYRGKRNEPAHVALVCDKLAELYDLAPQKIAETTTDVALRFFGLEEKGLAGYATSHQSVETRTHPGV